MLYGRGAEDVQRTIQRQRALIEGRDSRTRSLERQGSGASAEDQETLAHRRIRSGEDSDEDHATLAHARIRAGEDAHSVGLSLRDRPGVHEALVSKLDGHARAAVAAAPHAHDWDTHDQAYDAHIANPPKETYDRASPAWRAHHHTESEILNKKHEAWTALQSTAREHNADVQHLIRPRKGEKMHEHMRRIMTVGGQTEAISRNRGFSLRSQPGSHIGVYEHRPAAERLAATANHHWGKDHETKVEESPRSQFREWKVTTTEKAK